MTRTTREQIQRLFDRILIRTNNNGPSWTGTKSRVGAWYIDYAACYGGYSIAEIVNEAGGIRHVNGHCNRMPAREFYAFLKGMDTGLGLERAIP